MATTSEAVRRLSYKVDSDDAVRRIGNVQAAQRGVTAALNEGSAASDVNEARTAKLQSRYEELARQQRAYQNAFIRQAMISADQTNAMAAANDNYARSTSYVGDALRVATKTAVDHAASWAATAGAVGAGVLIFGALLSILGPIILAYKALKLVIDLTTEAWQLSGKALEEWRRIAEKAASVDLSTQFFQRITKAATDAKQPVDDITASIKRLGEVTQDKLGGSDFQNHLDKLTKAGNFQGNTGVSQLASANTTEEKFRAIVALVDQAMAKGERLAALDLTSKFLSPAAQAALAANSEYLKDMLASADAISKADLVSDENIGRALELKNRYDDAVKILETRWHPIQDLLTKGGIEMRAAWVSIVEAVAAGVDWVTKLVMKIGELPQGFWDLAKKGYGAALSTAVGAIPGIGTVVTGARIASQVMGAGDQTSGITPDAIKSVTEYGQAVDKLRAGLQNTHAVQQAVAETNAVQAGVWRDTSKAITEAAKATAEQKNQFDRTVESVEKHIARMNADAKAVGLGAGAQEEFRAKAALTTVAMQAGIPITRQLTDFIDALSKKAGEAGQNLAKVKVDESIRMQRQSIGLSPEDQQIAQQIARLYNNDIPRALASTEAAELRLINAQKLLADGFRDVGKEMFTAFVTGKNVMDAMVRSLDALASKLANAGFENLLSGIISLDPAQAALGALQAGASALISAFTSDQKAAKEVEEARKRWEAMADQLEAFNRAADGFDLGTLTSELNSLHASMMQLALAALEAREFDDLLRVQEQFNRGAVRIVDEFKRGNEVLSPFAEALRDLNGEARGLQESLEAIGLDALAAEIDATLPGLVQALRDQFSADMTDRLNRSINSSRGQDYLNEVAGALVDLGKNLADAALLGSDALAALANQEFILRAQAIVDAADLTGSAFDDLIAKFPQLAGAVREDAEERTRIMEEALEKQKRQALDYKQYIDQLLGGPDAALSPIDRLNTTEQAYREQLALARSGDTTAQQGLTGYFDRYREAAAGFYGTAGADYQRIISGGVADLRGLSALLAPGLGLVSDNGSGIVSGPTPSTVTAGGGSAAPWGDLAALRAELTALREEVKGLRADANQRLDTSNKVAATAHVESQQVLTSIDTTLEEIRSGDLLESARPAA